MKKLFVSALALALTLFSVGVSAQVDSVHVLLDTLSVSAQPARPEYRGAATRAWDIKNTRIALTFNYAERTADAREWITLHPYFYETDSLVLDAKSMRIDSVVLMTKSEKQRLDYTYAKDQLRIHFRRKYAANESIELYVRYTAIPYAVSTGGSGAITDDRGLYFINPDHHIPHKPAQIWTQGETESNSHWLITIDKPNTRFTTQVELTVPDSFTTLSNGALVHSAKGAHGLRTDVWKMDMPIQAYVVMFAIGKFSINKNTWRGKEVNYYTEPEFAPDAYLMFNHTPDMLEFFSQCTGVTFPWNKYSQVVVRDYVSGAMENTSAALFGEFMNQNAREIADRNNEDVVSHELFHEWFGDYVTCESWSNITVNESFANYGEQLWRRHKYGKASADELAYADLMGYIGGSQYNDPQLVRYYYDSREEVFDHISYNKGGAVLHYLNSLVGDAAFNHAMNLYLTKNALRSAEAQNWRMAVEEATGQDWNWFFDEWYFHAGHPVLKVSYNYNDTTQKLVVTVKQAQEDSTFLYRLPLKTAIYYGRERAETDWLITERKQTYTYAYKNGKRPLVVPDCAHVMPGDLKDLKKSEQWREQFARTDDYTSKKLALNAAGRVLSDTGSQAIIGMALNDNLPSIRRGALGLLNDTKNDKYQKKWTEYVTFLATNDSNRTVRALAIETLGNWKVKSAEKLMCEGLAYSSYAISGAALEAISKIDKDTAYEIARNMVSGDPKGSLENAIWTIIGKKGNDNDITLYERYVPYASGTAKYNYSSSLRNYLKNVSGEEPFARACDVLATMITNEELRSRRSGLVTNLFSAADAVKEQSKSEQPEEASKGARRLAVIKSAVNKVIDAEKDPESLKEDRKRAKEIFD